MGKNRGLLAWGMLVVSLSLISIAASRLIWGDQVHERALAKAQATVEWLKGCGIHWKNLFFFMLVAIPGMAILTRVIAWYAARFKEPSWRKPAMKEIEFLDESPIKPYATYEEYRKDLMGDVDLDHFLARCRAGLPADMLKTRVGEDLKGKVAREKLAEIQKRMIGPSSAGPLGLPQQPPPGSSPRDYRPV